MPGTARLIKSRRVPTQLGFTVQPSPAEEDVAISPAVVVALRDTNGNTASIAGVSITIDHVTGPGVLAGTLTQVTSAAGLATFTDLDIDTPNVAHQLRATSTGLTPVTSNTFAITAAAGGTYSLPSQGIPGKFDYDPAEYSTLAAMPETFDSDPPSWDGVSVHGVYTDTVNLTDTGNAVTNRINLQTAIDAADTNSTLITVEGPIEGGPRVYLRNHQATRAAGNEVCIAGAGLTIPYGGKAKSPASDAQLTFFQQRGSTPAIEAEAGAADYRICGFYFKMDDTVTGDDRRGVQSMIRLCPAAGAFSEGDLSLRIAVERNVTHGWDVEGRFGPAQGVKNSVLGSTATHGLKTGIFVAGRYVAVCGNSFYNIWAGTEAHGWEAFWGGPYRTVENTFEVGGIHIMHGAINPQIQSMHPRDHELRRNFLYRPTTWREPFGSLPAASTSDAGGQDWDTQNRLQKNVIESKACERLYIGANVLSGMYDAGDGGQHGDPFLMKSPVHAGGAVERTHDVLIEYNHGINQAQGFGDAVDAETKRIHWRHNLMEVKQIPPWTTEASYLRHLYSANSSVDVWVENNTVITPDSVQINASILYNALVGIHNTVCDGFVFRKNIVPMMKYGISGSGAFGVATLDANYRDLAGAAPNYTVTDNAFYGNWSGTTLPPGNYEPADMDAAFVNPSGDDYTPTPGTAWETWGADLTKVALYTAGVGP